VLLSKYAMEDDVVLGTPVANRDVAEIQDLLGCFVKYAILLLTCSILCTQSETDVFLHLSVFPSAACTQQALS
jgi:hypothetical protein